MSLLSPRLQLKVAQKQILTPGLVQMVTVLQLNRLELKEMITQEIVKNPVLEESAEGPAEEISPEELQPLLEAESVVNPADKQLLEAAMLNEANSVVGSNGDVAINGNLFPDAEEAATVVADAEVAQAADPLLDAPAPTDPFDEIDFVEGVRGSGRIQQRVGGLGHHRVRYYGCSLLGVGKEISVDRDVPVRADYGIGLVQHGRFEQLFVGGIDHRLRLQQRLQLFG